VSFGYPIFWVNPEKLPPEELGAVPDSFWEDSVSVDGLCFPTRWLGFDPGSEVPFSFRLTGIVASVEAALHCRQNSVDRATTSRAPARSELLRQTIEKLRRHVASILYWPRGRIAGTAASY
jgi:hypothetical protein